IIKTLGISQLILNSSPQLVPKEIINSVQSIFDEYIWNDKKTKIKREDIDKGGLNMLDYEIF
uniref:hypothetical protein n=1 Tax=Acinetobacter baumannii TaxID=470 RepID=UPI001C07614C